MQYLFEHCGVAVCAVTGALAGRGKRVDLVGVIVLALVTAVGGGTLRDVILDLPVFWIRDSGFVLTATVSALVTFVWARYREMPHRLLIIADAFGLALFTMIGAEKSLAAGAPPGAAIALGVITGVAGGVMRDVLSGEVPLVFRPESYWYATAAFCGAGVYVLLAGIWPGQPVPRLLSLATTLGLRLAAVQWRLSLPLFQAGEIEGPKI